MIINLIKLISALILAFYLRQLIQSFSFMSLNELRRRSELGSQVADRVLVARIHGLKLWLFLWFLLGLMIVAMVTALNDLLPFWPAALISIFVLIFLLFVAPVAKWPAPSLNLAAQAGSHLAKVLDKLQIFSRIFRPLGLSKRISVDAPPNIHSKDHLVEIMRSLSSKTKNKRVLADLNLAISTLTLSSKKIKSLMIPLEKTKKLQAAQNLTPKLIDELHNSGFSLFPVQRSREESFCGVLHLRDIENLSETSLTVHQAMRAEIYYVYANAPLNQVLDAFLKTQQQLFLVVDQSSQILGLITLKDVLGKYIGEHELDEFRYYDDLEMVAKQSVSMTVSNKPTISSTKGNQKSKKRSKVKKQAQALKKKIKRPKRN